MPEEIKEMYAECKLMHTNPNQKIQHIHDKMVGLEIEREYQKGLRDAAYMILTMIEAMEKEGTSVEVPLKREVESNV